MKIVLLILLACLVLGHDSCRKEDFVCGVEKPQENLPWLKQMLQQLDGCYEVYSFLFETKDYVSVADCKNTPDGMTFIYNCSGNLTFSYGGNSAPHGYGMPNTFTIDYYINHRKLLYITE